MEKHELIISTAKEILFKYPPTDTVNTKGHTETNLKLIDQSFKSIVKTITEAYESIGSSQKG